MTAAPTFWFTGLSASGKTTLARAFADHLARAGHRCMLLDGDHLRQGLNRDLGYSEADRHEAVRRIAEVAHLLNESGVIALVSMISPLRAMRAAAAGIIGTEAWIEVYVSTPLEICEARDPKGLYRAARAGRIAEFTGVSAPYEAPLEAAVLANAATASTADIVKVLAALIHRKS